MKKSTSEKDRDQTRKIVGKAYYGVVFKMLRQKSDWVEVQHESGLTGWVYSRSALGYSIKPHLPKNTEGDQVLLLHLIPFSSCIGGEGGIRTLGGV